MFHATTHQWMARRPAQISIAAIALLLIMSVAATLTSAQSPCQTSIIVQSPPGGGPISASALANGPCLTNLQQGMPGDPAAAAQDQLRSFQERMRAMNAQMGVPQHIQDQMDAQMAAMNAAIEANWALVQGQASASSFAPGVTVLNPPNQPRQLVFRFGSCVTIITLGSTFQPAFSVQTVCSD